MLEVIANSRLKSDEGASFEEKVSNRAPETRANPISRSNPSDSSHKDYNKWHDVDTLPHVDIQTPIVFPTQDLDVL